MATVVWSGTYSHDWTDGANWSTGGAPGPADDVVIPAASNSYLNGIAVPRTIANLSVEEGYSQNIGEAGLPLALVLTAGTLHHAGSGSVFFFL